tara:strand:- start:286 stop:513 length:228 start_codon:yes stop_codon:yes gene_type:complete
MNEACPAGIAKPPVTIGEGLDITMYAHCNLTHAAMGMIADVGVDFHAIPFVQYNFGENLFRIFALDICPIDPNPL